MTIWILAIVALVLSAVLCQLLIPFAWRTNLLDEPCNRKQHNGSVPLVGGIAIFLTTLILVPFAVPMSMDVRLFLTAAGFMVFIGVLDDRFDLNVGLRFTAQMLAAAVVVFGAGAQISQLGNLVGLGVVELGWFSMPFTLLAMVAAMNAYNMIDGMDGLLGSLALIAFAGIAVLAALNHQYLPLMAAMIISGALVPFLIRNMGIRNRLIRKIFMGDAGSMFIGFTVVWCLIILTHPQILIDGSINSTNGLTAVRPVAVLWIIAIPLMDMIAIMIRRMMKGQSPFKPDREHLHHIFMRAGFTQRQALLIISMMALLLAAVGITLELLQAPELLVLTLYISVFAVYLGMLKNIWRIVSFIRQKRDVEAAQHESP
ncbi:undecaprenyl-phosphate alpha-N-acetylglucosaminyl 1-phosphate transferase [Pseudidiomarina aestuarii]|uniref:Undecaprenyl-phosphate alpha-N-acetylglucosaminyl 1-phosphate transferase n=1 Tax=Pseudidiomarina aestuarii TaxID=624146 RepID=A0A7Z7EU03_9GAMM|nr:UDP-N-acetylglucosamine--undecaprenyl-phosphate N-acetylglucosaminephosphotransferase [Pseudidiomarina aestuarii]RUO41633.1 undecaprenyl-phosphate alpha-N-acetylglucosaminyl 1-phosphate transferase [Pseudidiomarina aestuarii]